MIKVLFVIPSLAKGGAERLVLDICHTMNGRPDVCVKLITFHEQNEYFFMLHEIDYKVVPSHYIPSMKGKPVIDVSELQKEIESFGPDIIHSHLFESEMVLSAINYPKSKYFVHFHDNMKQFENLSVQTFKRKDLITNYFEKRQVLKSYSKRDVAFIAISTDSFNYASATLPGRYKKTLLYNAINIKRFTHHKETRDALRLVNIGSLVNKKGQDLAIEVVKKLHERNLPVTLDFLGNGPDFDQLKEKIERYGLTEFVFLHGNVDHPEQFLAKSKVYLHTASYEPFGLVLIEAMADGLPIVCTDAKGNRDFMKDDQNGFIVWERNAGLIADKIELLLKNNTVWERISQNAESYSLQYDISLYVDKLLNLYRAE